MKRKVRQKHMQSREYALQEMGLATPKMTPRTLRIAPNWTPDQALAVFQTLDDLIDVIWRQYGLDIQQAFKNDRMTNTHNFGPASIDEDDVPF